MNNFDRMFIADKENDLITLQAIAADMLDAGIEPRRVNAMIEVVQNTIEGYKAGVEEKERQEAEMELQAENARLYEEFAAPVPPIQDIEFLITKKQKRSWWKDFWSHP